MKPVAQAFNPDQYLAEKEPAFDPDSYLAEREGSGGAGTAALQHFGNAASFGYLPQLAGKVMQGVGYLSDMAAGVPEEFRGGDDYLTERDATARELEQGMREHPGASVAGSVGGALTGGGVMSGGLGLLGKAVGVGKAAGMGGRILRAAGSAALAGGVVNPGDIEGEYSGPQVGERLGNAGKGMLVGGLLQGAGEGLRKGISIVSPKALDTLAETKALKAAGATKADFKSALQKDKVKDLGRTLLDETVDLTNPETGEVLTQKLVQAGDKFEDIAKKSAALKQQAGSQIGNIYKQVQGQLDDSKFLKTLSPDQLAKVRALQVNPQHMVLEIEKKLGESIGDSIDGPEVMSKVTKYLNRIWGKGDSIELPRLLKIKGEFDSKINYARRTQDLPEVQQAYSVVRNHIRDAMSNLVKGVGEIVGGDLGGKLMKANRLYGNASELADMATSKVAGEQANRMFGLTDTIAGGAGAGVGTVLSGGLGGAVTGAAAAMANKAARTYGNGLIASGANAISKGMKATPIGSALDATSGGLTELAGSGTLGPAGGLGLPSQKLHKGLIRENNMNRKLGSKK